MSSYITKGNNKNPNVMEQLKRMIWSDELSIGNNNIDKDHQQLIHIYNDLIDLIEFKKVRNEFSRILSMMTDYCLEHFKKEENYMKEFNYPYFEEHKQMHNEYKYKVAKYNIDLFGENPTDPEEIILYIKNWWTNHILKYDLKYESYKKSNNYNTRYKTF